MYAVVTDLNLFLPKLGNLIKKIVQKICSNSAMALVLLGGELNLCWSPFHSVFVNIPEEFSKLPVHEDQWHEI